MIVQWVTNLYDVTAYDATEIVEDSRDLGHVTLLSGPYRNFCVINSVGSTTAARKRVWRKMREVGAWRFPVLAHPGVDLRHVEVGEGTVIQEGSIIGPNVKIGSHCLITFGAVIAHDSCLADVICLSPERGHQQPGERMRGSIPGSRLHRDAAAHG